LQLVAPDYNCQTGAITFRTTGGDGSPIEYMAIGVKGWSTNPNGVIEAEKRADLNSGTTVNLLARQKGVVISYEFNFGTYCNGTTPSEELKIVDPKYDCSSSELTLLYSGGDGSPVEFFVEELTDWTSNSIHVIDIGFPQGKNFIIKARQKGLEISKSFYIAGCPYESSGIITLSGVEEKKFNPLNSKVTLTLNNALFSPNVEDFFIQVNDQQISPVSVNSNKVELELNLKDGLNTLSYYLKDSNGLLLEGHHQIWAGSKNMPVQVVNKANELISNAKVKISLSDDKNVIAEGTTVNGVVTFQNLPVRTIIATALTIDNLFGSAATVADGNLLTISLLSFDIPSTIDNNDISLGTQGWNIGNSPVKVILHEGSTASGFNAAAENQDLQLSTSGEGPRSMSRTFVSKPGTKTITIRYRFITSEIPGGYFGTQYNDYFSVSIRSKNSGTIASEQNSMNGLGYGAFNPTTGETAWREKTLSVGSEGEEIQVDVVVANVADDLLDSQVEVDFIDEKRLDISDIALLDPDQKNSLKYLSIDQHPYFGGKVPIYGTIKIKGPKEDRLNSLNLEVLQGGKVIATADLVSSAQSKLFEPFGSDEQVEINIKELLFEIPSTDPLDADGIVQLRINAKTENGQDATKDYDQSLPNMRLFKGTRDGSDRDEDEGGDGWGLPSVIQYADGLPAGWGVNDISNMCGNDTPDHKSHEDGVDIDIDFSGYVNRNAEVAQTLIDFLNSPLGNRVSVMFVTYNKAFTSAIQSVTLANGVKASTKIQNIKGHADHFHIRVTPATPTQQGILYAKVPRRGGGKKGAIFTSQPTLTLFPNPVQIDKQLLSIRIPNSDKQTTIAEIIRTNGQLVKTFSVNSLSEEAVISWDGTDFSGNRVESGMYLIKVRTSKGESSVKKLLIYK
ncbi:T9SS type A sorting domain-containing protein, partial [Larkinella arboricola]